MQKGGVNEKCLSYDNNQIQMKPVVVKYIILKLCLTQRGKVPLKDGNIIVYSDGVSYKL